MIRARTPAARTIATTVGRDRTTPAMSAVRSLSSANRTSHGRSSLVANDPEQTSPVGQAQCPDLSPCPHGRFVRRRCKFRRSRIPREPSSEGSRARMTLDHANTLKGIMIEPAIHCQLAERKFYSIDVAFLDDQLDVKNKRDLLARCSFCLARHIQRLVS
jgi:hypothetical protein